MVKGSVSASLFSFFFPFNVKALKNKERIRHFNGKKTPVRNQCGV